MSNKRLSELMDSLSPERRAKVEARAKERGVPYSRRGYQGIDRRAGRNCKPASPSLRKNCNITSSVETVSPLQDGTLVPRSWWARAGKRNFVHDPK